MNEQELNSLLIRLVEKYPILEKDIIGLKFLIICSQFTKDQILVITALATAIAAEIVSRKE